MISSCSLGRPRKSERYCFLSESVCPVLPNLDITPRIRDEYCPMCSPFLNVIDCSCASFPSMDGLLTVLTVSCSKCLSFLGPLTCRVIALHLLSTGVRMYASDRSLFCSSTLLSWPSSFILPPFTALVLTYFQSNLPRCEISVSLDHAWYNGFGSG